LCSWICFLAENDMRKCTSCPHSRRAPAKQTDFAVLLPILLRFWLHAARSGLSPVRDTDRVCAARGPNLAD
jgi:hypothetical protein